jgi:hypothetical protein
LLHQYPRELEADLARYYAVDLTDYYQGRMTMRRLSVLADQLPDGGHVWAAQTGEQPGWSVEALLLADVFWALTGEQHPSRKKSVDARTSSGTRVKDLRARLAEQQTRLTEQRTRKGG